MSLEERVARLEGGVEELSKRLEEGLAAVGKRMDDLRDDVDHRFKLLEERLARLESKLKLLDERADRSFRWTIGIMLATLTPMWASIMAAIILRP